MFGEYDAGTLREDMWQSLFKKYDQVLRTLGGNDFNAEDTRTRKRQREGVLEQLVAIDRDAFGAALNWWIDEKNGS